MVFADSVDSVDSVEEVVCSGVSKEAARVGDISGLGLWPSSLMADILRIGPELDLEAKGGPYGTDRG